MSRLIQKQGSLIQDQWYVCLLSMLALPSRPDLRRFDLEITSEGTQSCPTFFFQWTPRCTIADAATSQRFNSYCLINIITCLTRARIARLSVRNTGVVS